MNCSPWCMMFNHVACLWMCVLFCLSFVWLHVCAYVSKFKVHYGSAFEPGASGLPYYCTPLVCIPAVPSAIAVWQHNQKKNWNTGRKNKKVKLWLLWEKVTCPSQKFREWKPNLAFFWPIPKVLWQRTMATTKDWPPAPMNRVKYSRAGPAEIQIISAWQISARRKLKTQLNWVIHPVPHNLVRRIRFWRVKSLGQDFEYLQKQ